MPRRNLTMSGYAAGTESVSSTELHAKTRATLARAQGAAFLAITHYNEVDAFLVSPDRMQDLLAVEARESERVRELAETLPLLLAAAKVGAAIPSDTLERLIPGTPGTWQDVAEFAARYPVRLHTGEDGEPLARVRLHASTVPVEESGDDDDLNYDA